LQNQNQGISEKTQPPLARLFYTQKQPCYQAQLLFEPTLDSGIETESSLLFCKNRSLRSLIQSSDCKIQKATHFVVHRTIVCYSVLQNE